jgi:hypothetical protein
LPSAHAFCNRCSEAFRPPTRCFDGNLKAKMPERSNRLLPPVRFLRSFLPKTLRPYLPKVNLNSSSAPTIIKPNTSTRIDSSNLLNLQTIEAVVSGPDGANRLFTVTGMANASVAGSQKETFTVLIGPKLSRQQFHKAIGSAFLADIAINFVQSIASGLAGWSVAEVDADWDDESQQVELRVDLQTTMRTPPVAMNPSMARFGFQVTILAAV